MWRRTANLAAMLAATLVLCRPGLAQGPVGPSGAWLDTSIVASSTPPADGAASAGGPATSGPASAPAPVRLVSWVDYSGDLEHRAALTPDIQVIDPGRNISDTAVVLGLRMRIDF